MAMVGGDTRNVTLEELVIECTNDIQVEPDYSKQLDITERIVAQGPQRIVANCKEVSDAIVTRLEKKKKSENAVFLALTLADFCLKNVTPHMGHVMARDNFQKAIVKTVKNKYVKGRALILLVSKVQEWAYLFQNHKGFQETYVALQKLGVDFPPPSRELMEEQSRVNEKRIDRMNDRKKREAAGNNDHTKKLRDSIFLLQENVNLVIDMLEAVDPAKENVRENELIAPLLDSVGKQRPKIGELISTVEDEELMLILLDVNDLINNAFIWYDELCRGRKPNIRVANQQHSPEKAKPVSPPDPVPRRDSERQYQPQHQQYQPHHQQPQYQHEPKHVVADDPFAALAQARHAKERQQDRERQQRPQSPSQNKGFLDALFSVPSPPVASNSIYPNMQPTGNVNNYPFNPSYSAPEPSPYGSNSLYGSNPNLFAPSSNSNLFAPNSNANNLFVPNNSSNFGNHQNVGNNSVDNIFSNPYVQQPNPNQQQNPHGNPFDLLMQSPPQQQPFSPFALAPQNNVPQNNVPQNAIAQQQQQFPYNNANQSGQSGNNGNQQGNSPFF